MIRRTCQYCGLPLNHLFRCTNPETDCRHRCKDCGRLRPMEEVTKKRTVVLSGQPCIVMPGDTIIRPCSSCDHEESQSFVDSLSHVCT